jgi:hypothetical protein
MYLSLLETSSQTEKLMLIFAVAELSLLLQLLSVCVEGVTATWMNLITNKIKRQCYPGPSVQ